MAYNSGIQWTDHTFNPWIGCTKVSPGCENCYAETFSKRFGTAQWGAGEKRYLTGESNWNQPLKWDREAAEKRTRYRVFCASLADVFDNEVPAEWRMRLWQLIKSTPNLDWLLLTKRIGNAAKMLPESWGNGFPNVWLGASIVNQEEADRDIPKLLTIPARLRFLSMEPLLGPVSLRWLSAWPENKPAMAQNPSGTTNHLDGLRRIDWVIVGGESGAKARAMQKQWAADLRDQCNIAGVPFFFKQWGEFKPVNIEDMPSELQESYEIEGKLDSEMFRVGKKDAGRLLDGREWNEFPTIKNI